MDNKNVLITGAYGFIGRHAARFFARQGFNVIGMGHGSWPVSEWQSWGITEWHTCDITLDSLLTYGGEPSVILHCAGSGSVSFSMSHPFQDYQRTVATTLNILEFARLQATGARIIYPSSAAVYGIADKLPISENCVLKPISPYGVHKKLAEDLCRSYARYFGISAAIIRLFSVYGTGLRKQLLWDACSRIGRNEVSFGGTGRETRDWLHVEDTTSLLFKAVEYASTDCPVINGGCGTGVTVAEVLTEIFSCFNRPDLPVFQGTIRSGDPMHYLADTARSSAWNWKPKVNWRDGIREYVEWYKEIKL